jgi:hypothetical protein
MTAHEFIDQLFERPQPNVATNMRYVTPGQLELLRVLIGQDVDGRAMSSAPAGGFTWSPRGRYKYQLAQDPNGNRRSLIKLAKETRSGVGLLFD